MAYFIRMVGSAKWLKCKDDKIKDIMDASADTITSDLRTQLDTLSIWRVETLSDEEINKILLALSLSRDSLTRLDIVIIEDQLLDGYGLEYHAAPETADTPYISVKQQHFDLIGLNYKQLGNFGNCILNTLENQDIFLKKISKKDLLNLWVESYQNYEFDLDTVSTKIRDEINKKLSA